MSIEYHGDKELRIMFCLNIINDEGIIEVFGSV
jgi:hypothetical protein